MTATEVAASVHPTESAIAVSRRIAAEGIGSAFLLMAVVGSGIMAERLAGGNIALALLGNTLATGAMLVVLISVFGPISGAHFNPAVTFYFLLRREIGLSVGARYVAVQIVGAILGVYAAHVMFGMPVVEVSHRLRDGPSQWFSEFIATIGLIATIAGSIRFVPAATPALVGLYIAAAYWFTASTSFANPAVTVARAFSDSFAGIAPGSAPGFLAAQMLAAVVAWLSVDWLFVSSTKN